MRTSELAWKHPRGALWVALKCGHTGSVYFQLRKQGRWGGEVRWGERRAQSADEFQASFLHASKVTLGPSPVTCDLVFLSPLLPGEMGRKDPSDLRASELRRGGGVGTGTPQTLRWVKKESSGRSWVLPLHSLVYIAFLKKPSQQRFEVRTTVVSICSRKKRSSEKVRSLLKAQSNPAELEFEPDRSAFLITMPYGLKPQ